MKKLYFFLLFLPFILILVSCSGDNKNVITENETSNSALFKQGGGPSANGQGVLIFDGQKQTFSFHAREDKNGIVSGSIQIKVRLDGEDVLTHGYIDCMNIFSDGKTAFLSGKLKEPVTLPPPFSVVSEYFWFAVSDNGEGSKAEGDLFSDFYFLYGPDAELGRCDNYVPAGAYWMSIENGNFQVKP